MTPQRGPRSTSPHGAAHRSKPRISPFRWRIASRYLRGGAHLSVARGRVRHPRLLPCTPTAPGASCGILDPQAIRARMRARRISAAGSLPPSGKIASARKRRGFRPTPLTLDTAIRRATIRSSGEWFLRWSASAAHARQFNPRKLAALIERSAASLFDKHGTQGMLSQPSSRAGIRRSCGPLVDASGLLSSSRNLIVQTAPYAGPCCFPAPEIRVYVESTHPNNVYETSTYLNICGNHEPVRNAYGFRDSRTRWLLRAETHTHRLTNGNRKHGQQRDPSERVLPWR